MTLPFLSMTVIVLVGEGGGDDLFLCRLIRIIKMIRIIINNIDTPISIGINVVGDCLLLRLLDKLRSSVFGSDCVLIQIMFVPVLGWLILFSSVTRSLFCLSDFSE